MHSIYQFRRIYTWPIIYHSFFLLSTLSTIWKCLSGLSFWLLPCIILCINNLKLFSSTLLVQSLNLYVFGWCLSRLVLCVVYVVLSIGFYEKFLSRVSIGCLKTQFDQWLNWLPFIYFVEHHFFNCHDHNNKNVELKS